MDEGKYLIFFCLSATPTYVFTPRMINYKIDIINNDIIYHRKAPTSLWDGGKFPLSYSNEHDSLK